VKKRNEMLARNVFSSEKAAFSQGGATMDHQAGNPQASQRQGDQSTPDVWGRDDPEEGQGQQRVSGPLSMQLLASQMAQPGTLVPVQAPPRPPKPPRRKNRLLILLGASS
jgi:hypothetical protein